MSVPDPITVELEAVEAEWLARLADFLDLRDLGPIPSGLRRIRDAYTAAAPEAQEEPSWWRGEPVYDLDGRDVSACDYCRAIQTRDWQAADYAACTCGRRA